MTILYVFRENVTKFLQKYHSFAKPILKFLVAFILFHSLNSMYGYASFLNGTAVVIGLSFISAFLSLGILFFLSGIVTIVHLMSLSLEIAVIYIFIFVIAYLLYIRLEIKSSLPMIFVPILFLIKLPFLAPILVGMFLGPVAIVPTVFGVLLYNYSVYAKDAVALINTTSSGENMKAYTYIIDQILKDQVMLVTIIVFALVITITWLIYRLAKDYAWQYAIVFGGLANIILFLAGVYMNEINIHIINIIIGTVIAVVIALVIQFFRCVVDYSRIENVQFEDDEYYYYVRAVPKVTISAKDVRIKKINTRKKVRNNVN